MKLVIFDIETTGLVKKMDQIIKFSGIKVNTETNKTIEEINEYIQPVGNYQISYGAYFKHGITAEFLKDKPHFEEVSQKIIDFFGNDAILTYNGNGFDIPFLLNELNKYVLSLDIVNRQVFDAFLEEKRNGNSLEETYKRYKGKTMEESGLKAHDTLSDVKATYSVFYAQQKHIAYPPEHIYGEDSVITDQEFRGKIKPCFNICKYRGLSIEFVGQIDQQYLNWVISNKCNFSENSKKFIQNFVK